MPGSNTAGLVDKGRFKISNAGPAAEHHFNPIDSSIWVGF